MSNHNKPKGPPEGFTEVNFTTIPSESTSVNVGPPKGFELYNFVSSGGEKKEIKEISGIFDQDLQPNIPASESTSYKESYFTETELALQNMTKEDDVVRGKQDIKEYTEIIDGLKSIKPGAASVEVPEDQIQEYKIQAEKLGITIEEVAKKDGKDVFVENVKTGVEKIIDDEGNEIEQEIFTPVYKIRAGYANNVDYINDKDAVIRLVEKDTERLSQSLRYDFKTFKEFTDEKWKIEFNGGRAIGTIPKKDWLANNNNQNYKELQKEYRKETYDNFINAFENRYGYIVDAAIDNIGNRYRVDILARPAINMLNIGLLPSVVKEAIGKGERADIDLTSTAFIKQGDIPDDNFINRLNDEIGEFITGKPPEVKTSEKSGERTAGVNLDKVKDVLNFYADFVDGSEDIKNKREYESFQNKRENAIENLLSKYGNDGATKLTRDILENPNKLKDWYLKYAQRGVDYTFEDAGFLYNNKTGELIYGDFKYVDDRREQAEQNDEDVVLVKSEKELKKLISKELDGNLKYVIPEKDGDLEDVINTAYYNILGLQRELLKTGQVRGEDFTVFNKNVKDKTLTGKPKALEGDSFLVKKYNDEVAKLALLSQAYKLNLDPMDIEKEGFFGGVREGIANMFRKDIYTADEAKQDFYELYISKDPELANDPAFSEDAVKDLYEKTFLNKVGYGTPEFLKIMAEFAIVRRLGPTSLKNLGTLVESIGKSYNFGAKTTKYVAAFVEELAVIEGVNFTFGEDMSWMFAITGPVGRAIDDFYQSFFSAAQGSTKRAIGQALLKQPEIIKTFEDGTLKLVTSGVVLKIGETPDAIVESIKKGTTEPLMHLYDPEEFAVLLAQLQVTKGIAPIKSTIRAIKNTKLQIEARQRNEKYKNLINESNAKLGLSGAKPNKSAQQKSINKAYNSKLKKLGVDSRFVETLDKMGLKYEDIEGSNSIQDLIGKLDTESPNFNKNKKILETLEGVIDIKAIKEINELSVAKDSLLLNSEYDAFLEAQSQEGTSNQTKILEQFGDGYGKNIGYNANSIKALNYLKSPTLIKQFLASYGITPNKTTGKYESNFLNEVLKPGANNTFPNLSFVLTQFGKLSNNNIDLNSKAGSKAVSKIDSALRFEAQIENIKEQLKDNPPNSEQLKESLNDFTEKRDAVTRDIDGDILEGKAENRMKSEQVIDKVIAEQDKLKLGGTISKVENKQKLIEKYKEKKESNNESIKDIDTKLESLDKESSRAKELILQKQKLQADNKILEAEITDVSKEGYLHKGKALELSTGKEIIFNMADIFKAADPTVAAHELLHPYINAKIRELGLSGNKEALQTFMSEFKESLSEQQIDVVKRRLKKMGINFNKLEELPQNQQLEIFNAYVEGVVLGEITYKPGTVETAKAAEFLEAFIETRNGGIDVRFDNPSQAIKTIITEYGKEMSRLDVEGQTMDPITKLISLGDEASPFDYSVQSSKVKLEDKLDEYKNELENLPADDVRVEGLKRNISVITKMLEKTDNINKQIEIIDQSIAKEGDFNTDRTDEFRVRRAENELYKISNQPGGPLYKLKQSFDFNKVDQQYSNIDKLELKKDFDAQANVYFSMALRNYIAKPADQRAPFAVYLEAYIGKKFTDTLANAKINQEQFKKRITEESENGIMNETSGDIFEPGETEVKEESPFEFDENVVESRNKAFLQIYSIKETGKKLIKQIDNTIRIFMVDPIKNDMLSKAEGKTKAEKEENILFKNYDKVALFLDANSPWLRLRNFPLFYKAELTEGGNIKRKGKAEEPQYRTIIPSQKQFVDFFMARGDYAPPEGQSPSNIKSQRMLKFYELIGRIDLGYNNTVLAENGGNVIVNGKTINVINNAMGYNPKAFAMISEMQEASISSSKEMIVDQIETRNTFEELVGDKDFQNEVKLELKESYGFNNMFLNKYKLAVASGKESFKFNGEDISVKDTEITISEVTQNLIIDKIDPSKGEGRTAIDATIERSNAMTPEYKRLNEEFNLSKEEVDERKKIGEEAMRENDYAGVKREEANRRRENDETLSWDNGTKTSNSDKRKNYIDALKNIAEYGLSVEAVGGDINTWAKIYGDHRRTTGAGVTIDGQKIKINAVELLEKYPDLVIGGKNDLNNFTLKGIEKLGDEALLNTFLKMDPKELDAVSKDKNINNEKRRIINMLAKRGIYYLDPSAKNEVMKIVMNEQSNIDKLKAVRSKYIGAFKMYWSVPKSELKNPWSVWTKITKGDCQNVFGTRGHVILSFAEINNLSHEQIWEKLEHGKAIANFNETANALIQNGKLSELRKLISAFEGGYGSRSKFQYTDLEYGTTSRMGGGIGDAAKVLTKTIKITTDKAEQKEGELGEVIEPAIETFKQYHFMYKGEPTSFHDAFQTEFNSTIQSSKEKYTNKEKEVIEGKVFKKVTEDKKIIKNEIKLAIQDFKDEKVVSNTNKKFLRSQGVPNKISSNSIQPKDDVSNAQFNDQGNNTNWNQSFTVDKAEGSYSYDAQNNVATVPNNTGKFNPNKKVVFLAGGAGSGKGTTWTKISNQHPELKGLKIVNSDFEKQRLKDEFDLPKDESNLAEDQRSLLSRITGIAVNEAKIERKELTDEGKGYVVDGTLASYNSNKKAIQELRDKGYEVQIIYTKTDVEVASKRNAERTDRSIKDKFLRRNHEDVINSIEKFRADGENVIEFNGEGEFNSTAAETVFNSLNKNDKIDIGPDPEVGIQSSTEFYKEESDRIISNRYKLGRGKMDQAVADKMAKGKRRRIKFMGFKAQQAMNLMLEIVPKGDKEALTYVENGVDLADGGRYDFGKYSSSTYRDIKSINKSDRFKDINLQNKIKEGSPWTKEDAVRMYLWTKNGETIPGIKEAEIYDAIDFVMRDQKLFEYANKVEAAVNKAGDKPWLKPYENWGSTSLKYDINKAVESRRATFMEPFKNWYENTFSADNLAKIKAGMGEKDFNNWKLSTQDWYERAMTNRTRAKGEPVGQKFVNWLHGSTALALFGNRKSAFTQLLSTSNFYGAKNNNIFQAASAYGNIEIFDMMRYILKSDYLKDRRGSYDIALKEINELQSKFGDFYKKGINLSFLLSQLGDNAAITVGGASMLLNNYKALMRENPKLTRDEALEAAMKEVALHSERTQQSTWASNLTYQQTKAIGKVTLNFLNTQVRYNNIALEEMRKIGKGVSEDVSKSIMRVINYTGLQVAGFAVLSSGLQYVLMDDELDPERKEKMTNTKKQQIIENTMFNIVNGTGISGKATTTLIGMLDYVIETSTDKKRVDAAEFAKKSLQVSPALSIKFRKLESAGYDIQAAMRNYDKGLGWKKPAGRAATELFSAGTNIAAPEYIYSLMDQYDFIMNERYTFWQQFGAAMGWSLYSMDQNFYKNRKEQEASEVTDEVDGYQTINNSVVTGANKGGYQGGVTVGSKRKKKPLEIGAN